MINEEKVRLMTRASCYEAQEAEKKMKINQYYRHDYISVNLVYGWFWMTVCFLLGVALWGVCNMEELMTNLHKMDLQGMATKGITIYVMLIGVYLCFLYVVYAIRYHQARKSTDAYGHVLKKISHFYQQDEKKKYSEKLSEDEQE